MADVDKVKQGGECCDRPYGERKCRECPYKQFPKPYCNIQFGHDALVVIESQQAEIERLCKKIGVMKESIEDAIMSETVFDTFDDLISYVNAERCRSEDWTGGIRDAIQAVRAWGE